MSQLYTGLSFPLLLYKSGYPNVCKNSCAITPDWLDTIESISAYVFNMLYAPIFFPDQYASAS